MFFKPKSCSLCEDNLAEMKLLREQLAKAKVDNTRLNKLIDTLRIEISQLTEPKSTRELTHEVPERQVAFDAELKREKAALAGNFLASSITLREEIVTPIPQLPNQTKPNTNSAAFSIISEGEGSRAQKSTMSDEDRLRLQQKRAALKAKLGSNFEEVEHEGQIHSIKTSEGNRSKKITMSDQDRLRLQQKRAALKAKVGATSEEIQREGQIQAIEAACEQHLPALLRNFRRSQVYNDYNVLTLDGREFESSKFLDSLQINYNQLGLGHACRLVVENVEKLQKAQVSRGFSVQDHPEDGWEFEHWVAEALQKFGWQAHATQGSGDQGVDVVATKGGLTLGIQCKRYSGSVGNKAVQEAFSGAKHMGLSKAAVLTNAEFTKSAKDLAVTTGVLLLSPEDIPTLSERPDFIKV